MGCEIDGTMILEHMSPSSTAQHIIHAGRANAVFPSKIRHADTIISVSSSYVNDLPIGELCVRMILAPLVAFLGYFIRHVVGPRTQEMMCRITAWWTVAVMTHDKPVRDWSFRQFVGNAVCRKRSTTATNMESTVTHWVSASLPIPAIVGASNVDIRPKTFYVRSAPGVVSVNKAHRLTLYMPASIFVSYRNGGLLSAPAMAITVRDFLRSLFCGMIAHVNSLLSAIGHSVGLLAQSPRFLVDSQVYYTMNTTTNQVELTL